MTLTIKEQTCLVPLAKGRAQSEERCSVTSVMEVGTCGLHALTVNVVDLIGSLRSAYLVRWREGWMMEEGAEENRVFVM